MTIIAFMVGGITFVWSVKSNGLVLGTEIKLTDRQNQERFERIDAQIENFAREMKKLGDILVDLTKAEGRQNLADERMLAQGRRIDSLQDAVNHLQQTRSV
jgi:hypothetical protein